ncbi:probable WRKY transcription factor 65 isoform X2 [Alnus glutinosa]|uniref:probable WRKY transcription factor 65 isoform X2 n=1 Tax=Alnus glutinosa TaxID=3517 RepID=UPI002D767A6B|nr:probable WRKY transcription factor 65 isoform X2 [Alnus glutinosa]
MDRRFINNHPFTGTDQDDQNEATPENGAESPPSSIFNDMKITSVSSPRKRRTIQKRVVSVPIKDVEGSRLKGESNTPPSDSWAWRKYGQKPIKGSPYPRGYYRCSSSKGCPARKQVERSRLDPTMLVVTYSCEHNHAWPASRSHHNQSTTPKTEKPEPIPDKQLDQETTSSAVLADLGDESLMLSDEFGWFSDMETTSSTVLESPIFAESSVGGVSDVAMFFPMREEDESLYADLGELPECSVVFRGVGPGVEIY